MDFEVKIKKPIIVFGALSILCFFIVVFWTIKTSPSHSELESKSVYYDRYSNILLYGKIVDKISIDNDRYSTYFIEVSKSNTQLHDLRDSASNYFLVINGNNAKMVYAMSYSIFVNDSIEINYKNKVMLIFRNGQQIQQYPLPSFSDIYLSMLKNGINK
jgi:AAA+ ATPase superfamily predicted ATPase